MKVKIGYHASHEQFLPSELLRWAVAAEGAGFQAALSSDHFYPWSEQQGQSGFACRGWGGGIAGYFPNGVWYRECTGATLSSGYYSTGMCYPGRDVSGPILDCYRKWTKSE